jgi:hypothetical protein
VGLFSKRRRDDAPSSVQKGPPRFGEGRRLSSAQHVTAAIETLEGVLNTYAPTPYVNMPCLTDATIGWHGDPPAPAEARVCSYGDDILVLTFHDDGESTVVGLFPLGADEESLHTPLIGQWKGADASLKSIGRFDAGLLTLKRPTVPSGYFDELLAAAGFPATPNNVTIIAEHVHQQFLTKAWQFIASTDESAARRFLDDHIWRGEISGPQAVLDALGDWNPQVVPYIQDLPWRIRGILLEPNLHGVGPAKIWDDVTR